MNEPSSYIRDHQSLVELNNTLEYTADSILKILEQVNAYIQGVKKVLKEQMEMLQEELRAAEEKLSDAEQALSDCEDSQKWDEEKEEYLPSCSWQKGRVKLAREIRDKCKERVEKAQKIIDECEYEISEYKRPPGIFTPAGGEKTMEYLAQDHTDKATGKLREILEVVEEYLKFPMSAKKGFGTAAAPDSNMADSSSDTVSLSPEQKKERFENAIQKVIERQHSENYGYSRVADANRVMKCPRCGRPAVACICSNTREREYTREQIYIIENGLSR